MRRELPVRFREGLGVKLPRATRLVVGAAHESDARRVLDVLPKRFARFGLTLHPEKTRLVQFVRPTVRRPGGGTGSPCPSPGSLDFLGFTHYWGLSRQGYWVVKRRTAKNRFGRALRSIADRCRGNRHRPIGEQHLTIGQKVRGHYAYYGLPGNGEAWQRLRYEVTRVWRKWLVRRRRGGSGSWDWLNGLLRRFPLPLPVPIRAGP